MNLFAMPRSPPMLEVKIFSRATYQSCTSNYLLSNNILWTHLIFIHVTIVLKSLDHKDLRGSDKSSSSDIIRIYISSHRHIYFLTDKNIHFVKRKLNIITTKFEVRITVVQLKLLAKDISNSVYLLR